MTDQACYVQIDHLAMLRDRLDEALRLLDEYERQQAAERTAKLTVSPCDNTVWYVPPAMATDWVTPPPEPKRRWDVLGETTDGQ